MKQDLWTNRISWEDIFLKAVKIICSVKQDLNSRDRNIKLNLSIIASVSFSNKLMLKTWNYRMLNTDTSNLDENKFVYKKNYLRRKRFSEILKSEACTKWEKWRELKEYELTKSQCKNCEKIKRQYKSLLLSCKKCKNRWILWVTQESFKIPSSRSMLSRDQRLPFDTWNTSGLQETFLVINFLRLIPPRSSSRISLWRAPQRERGYQFFMLQGRRLSSQEMTSKIEAQFQCRHMQEGRRQWVLQHRWTFRRILW